MVLGVKMVNKDHIPDGSRNRPINHLLGDTHSLFLAPKHILNLHYHCPKRQMEAWQISSTGQ